MASLKMSRMAAECRRSSQATSFIAKLLLEKLREIAAGHRALDVTERARVADLARGVDEPGHRGAIQRRRVADAAHAGRGQLGHAERTPGHRDHEIHRLRDR